ncbi:hypothetical protein NDU88_004311 [Pleurodeles waltl]|uniref:Uncharacterized protein n=1 Tax=Pleurodeles waltl TaxID=8319 RepID=A0AAV7VIB3_PLEWA|nr:hypothetical protein NDU88_004311 [Pleurodeles waltl]
MVYRKTKLRDEVAALQERQLLMKETIESAVTQGDQMEARCTALAVRVAKQNSRQKPNMSSAVQVKALVRKQKISDNDDDWNWEDEVEVHVEELGGVESGEGSVGEVEDGRGGVMEVHPFVQNKSKGVNGGQIQNSRLVRDYTQRELLEITRMFRQMPAEPLSKWLVRLWDTRAKDALQNPFMLGPITEGDPFELEIIVQDDVDDVVMWRLWQRQGKKRMPQGFWSKRLTPSMSNYTPLGKELAGAYWALV